MFACAGCVLAAASLAAGSLAWCVWDNHLCQCKTCCSLLTHDISCADWGQVINLLFVLAYTAEMFAKMAQERTLKCACADFVPPAYASFSRQGTMLVPMQSALHGD